MDFVLGNYGMYEVAAWVQRETWGYESCLEFGCGRGAFIREALCPVKAGIEAFEPYVLDCRESQLNFVLDIEFIFGDMRNFESLISRNYDVAMFIDSLEHIKKEEAFDLVSRCKERFKKILIFIPLNERGAGNTSYYDDNPLQKHESDWDEDSLGRLGVTYTARRAFHKNLPEGFQDAAYCTWVAP